MLFVKGLCEMFIVCYQASGSLLSSHSFTVQSDGMVTVLERRLQGVRESRQVEVCEDDNDHLRKDNRCWRQVPS